MLRFPPQARKMGVRDVQVRIDAECQCEKITAISFVSTEEIAVIEIPVSPGIGDRFCGLTDRILVAVCQHQSFDLCKRVLSCLPIVGANPSVQSGSAENRIGGRISWKGPSMGCSRNRKEPVSGEWELYKACLPRVTF